MIDFTSTNSKLMVYFLIAALMSSTSDMEAMRNATHVTCMDWLLMLSKSMVQGLVAIKAYMSTSYSEPRQPDPPKP